jgi:hypothetical protein
MRAVLTHFILLISDSECISHSLPARLHPRAHAPSKKLGSEKWNVPSRAYGFKRPVLPKRIERALAYSSMRRSQRGPSSDRKNLALAWRRNPGRGSGLSCGTWPHTTGRRGSCQPSVFTGKAQKDRPSGNMPPRRLRPGREACQSLRHRASGASPSGVNQEANQWEGHHGFGTPPGCLRENPGQSVSIWR